MNFNPQVVLCMILCAEKDGVVTLVEPDAKMPEGSIVR